MFELTKHILRAIDAVFAAHHQTFCFTEKMFSADAKSFLDATKIISIHWKPFWDAEKTFLIAPKMCSAHSKIFLFFPKIFVEHAEPLDVRGLLTTPDFKDLFVHDKDLLCGESDHWQDLDRFPRPEGHLSCAGSIDLALVRTLFSQCNRVFHEGDKFRRGSAHDLSLGEDRRRCVDGFVRPNQPNQHLTVRRHHHV